MRTLENSRKRETILTLFGVQDVAEHESILRALDRGVDINTKDSGGRTMLMEAVHRKDCALAEQLVRNGADVNVRDHRDWTALHFAAQNYDGECVRLLIEREADVNAQDSYRNSVISKAVFDSHDNPEIIELLLEAGPDPFIQNKSGISARDLARTVRFIAVSETINKNWSSS